MANQMTSTPEPISLELTRDEALVLFEFLARYDESDQLGTVDQAEERALWHLHAMLERVMVEPFSPEYAELLAAARERLRDAPIG